MASRVSGFYILKHCLILRCCLDVSVVPHISLVMVAAEMSPLLTVTKVIFATTVEYAKWNTLDSVAVFVPKVFKVCIIQFQAMSFQC